MIVSIGTNCDLGLPYMSNSKSNTEIKYSSFVLFRPISISPVLDVIYYFLVSLVLLH